MKTRKIKIFLSALFLAWWDIIINLVSPLLPRKPCKKNFMSSQSCFLSRSLNLPTSPQSEEAYLATRAARPGPEELNLSTPVFCSSLNFAVIVVFLSSLESLLWVQYFLSIKTQATNLVRREQLFFLEWRLSSFMANSRAVGRAILLNSNWEPSVFFFLPPPIKRCVADTCCCN